jgi:hypothetical protein
MKMNLLPEGGHATNVRTGTNLNRLYKSTSEEAIESNEAEGEEGEEEEEESDEYETPYSYNNNSQSQEYYTPIESRPSVSEETVYDGGDTEEITESEGNIDLEFESEPITSQDIEYTDTQMYSDYDTELQELNSSSNYEETIIETTEEDNKEKEESEESDEAYAAEGEEEEDEQENSETTMDFDPDYEYSEDSVTQNILKKKRKKTEKVDIRAVLIFDELTIKIAEIADKKGLNEGKYEGLIDTGSDQIPHMDILQISLEKLEIEYTNVSIQEGGKTNVYQNVSLVMDRIYIEDLQEEQNLDRNGNFRKNQ